jgi:hypothetical protein
MIFRDGRFFRTNPGFVADQSLVEDTVCNKDAGGLKAFHCWSRGVFVIVSPGGHIEYWQPLYRYKIMILYFQVLYKNKDKVNCK